MKQNKTKKQTKQLKKNKETKKREPNKIETKDSEFFFRKTNNHFLFNTLQRQAQTYTDTKKEWFCLAHRLANKEN